MKSVLYLASQSASRKRLLQETGIPFELLTQSADEQACDWTLPLEKLVESIALHKMASLLLPTPDKGSIWLLTADTLGQDTQGRIYAKPVDYADAVAQIKAQRDQWVRVATAFCIERRVVTNGRWQTDTHFSQTVTSELFFSIDDDQIDTYITSVGALSCAGSLAIDGFGAQYLKALNGSYSSVIGLPLFELRQALARLGFFT